jgi:pimeloyl-ACP methyl ester carboxylesterase
LSQGLENHIIRGAIFCLVLLIAGPGWAKRPFERELRHALALQASGLVYDLSDVTIAKSGRDLIAKHAEFRSKIPAGYRPFHYMADRTSGLKYLVLEPENPAAPWIFSFAGTENVFDWLGNLGLGRAQFADIEGWTHFFTNRNYLDVGGTPLGDRDWILTGHSLGGGLAQALAYRIQKRRAALGLVPVQMEVVTFNAFGAADLAEGVGVAPLSSIVDSLRASHYFVTGDPVSKIGRHIGPTRELKMTAPARWNVLEMARRHSMKVVRERAMPSGLALFGANLASPSRGDGALAGLRRFGRFVPSLPRMAADVLHVRSRHVEVIEEAMEELAKRSCSNFFDSDALVYLSNHAFRFMIELEKIQSGPLRDVFLKRLQAVVGRVTTLRKFARACR